MTLSDIKIKSTKAKEKDYKLFDGDGLFLLVTTKGHKYGRFKYRFDGKEKLLALGTYPERPLVDAHRVKYVCGQIFRYAVQTGRAERDVTADLRGALPPVKVKNYAALTDPKDVAQLLRDIDSLQACFPVMCALRLAPMLLVRPGGGCTRGCTNRDYFR